MVAESEAEVVIHQLTAFGTKDGDPYAETIRVRIEGTRNLVSAARAARVRRFIAQSTSFMCSPFVPRESSNAALYLSEDRKRE